MPFIIDGKEYEVPTLDSITIGESRIVKRYTGVSGQALQDLDAADPDMTAAMIHIAFARENPGMSFAALERMVDAVKFASLDFVSDEEDEAPLEVTPPESTAASSPADETPSSGDDGTTSGEQPLATLSQLPFGVQASGTGLGSAQETSQS